MTARRVVVTGFGITSPLGATADTGSSFKYRWMSMASPLAVS